MGTDCHADIPAQYLEDIPAQYLSIKNQKRRAIEKRKNRLVEFLCFWVWPWGHVWEPVDTMKICTVCGKERHF